MKYLLLVVCALGAVICAGAPPLVCSDMGWPYTPDLEEFLTPTTLDEVELSSSAFATLPLIDPFYEYEVILGEFAKPRRF